MSDKKIDFLSLLEPPKIKEWIKAFFIRQRDSGATILFHGLYQFGDEYKSAADLIADEILLDERRKFLLRPMLFLYRHFIELNLKGIAEICNSAFDANIDYENEHSLGKIWNSTKSFLLSSAFFTKEIEGAEDFERCINEFNSIDVRSTIFRYPLPIKDSYLIDVKALKNNMELIDHFLLGLDGYLGSMRDID